MGGEGDVGIPGEFLHDVSFLFGMMGLVLLLLVGFNGKFRDFLFHGGLRG